MAVSSMSESQKQMLVKLRRRLEMNPQVMVYEEKARFYRALETLEDSQEPDAVSVAHTGRVAAGITCPHLVYFINHKDRALCLGDFEALKDFSRH